MAYLHSYQHTGKISLQTSYYQHATQAPVMVVMVEMVEMAVMAAMAAMAETVVMAVMEEIPIGIIPIHHIMEVADTIMAPMVEEDSDIDSALEDGD